MLTEDNWPQYLAMKLAQSFSLSMRAYECVLLELASAHWGLATMFMKFASIHQDIKFQGNGAEPSTVNGC